MPDRRTLLFIILAFFFAPCFGAWAQTDNSSSVDRVAWQDLVDRAERAIDSGRASDSAFDAVRQELVEFRDIFTEAQEANADRIARLESQLSVLAETVEGQEVSPEIAQRRSDLNQQLQELQTPVLAAREALEQADGLILEVDRILAVRRSDVLFSIGPIPLNVEYWPKAWSDLSGAYQTIVFEFREAYANPLRRDQFLDNLPLNIFMVVAGLSLIFGGRPYAQRLCARARNLGARGTGVWHFVASLSGVLLPALGLVLLTEALFASGLVGLRSGPIIAAVPLWGAIVLTIVWLCHELFSPESRQRLLYYDSKKCRQLRFVGWILGLLFVASMGTNALLMIEDVSVESYTTINFPILLTASIALICAGQILVRGAQDWMGQSAEGEGSQGLTRILWVLGRAATLVGIVSATIGAVGYMPLAEAILYPALISLTIFAFIKVLQRFISRLCDWFVGDSQETKPTLVPTLAGIALLILSIPLFAIAWGVRPSALVEIWLRFNEGVVIGDARISTADFVVLIVVFVAGYMLTRLFKSTLKGSLLPKTNLDPGAQTAIISGTGYLGIFIAAVVAITAAGIDLSALAIVAGALSVGIGFGLQNIVSNFVSGIILLIERPISEGDWIEVNGNMGHVRNISVRSTRIETFDRTDVIVPNADLVSGIVTNFTRGNTLGRVIISVGVAYGSDTRQVEAILLEVAESHSLVLREPPPSVIFQGFGTDSLDFEIRAILVDVNYVLRVKSELNHAINERFNEAGIEIPFAQRDLWLRNPEVLPLR
ncbi:MAG: mechanosensitive ion channel [Aestuariivita sp.]|nr:mechanosensitive ion channel [Aestuariivita sp.]MCY4347798.1 mechanosensitive ion channel [Aestuariivita sp.]